MRKNVTLFVISTRFQAIRSTSKDDDTQWLTYWTVFAFFSVIDFFSEPIMDALPLYWLVKYVKHTPIEFDKNEFRFVSR